MKDFCFKFVKPPQNTRLMPLCCEYYYPQLNSTIFELRLKSCSWRVGGPRWRESLTMVTAGNKATHFSSVNHYAKTIHHLYRKLSLQLFPTTSVNEFLKNYYYLSLQPTKHNLNSFLIYNDSLYEN